MDIVQIVISDLSLNGWTTLCVWKRIIKLSQLTSALGHDNKGLQKDLFGETILVSFWFSAVAVMLHVLTLAFKLLTSFLSLS